jgi:hypothetical protein
MANIGYFPQYPNDPGNISFFQTGLPTIKSHLNAASSVDYVNAWHAVFAALPASTEQRVLSSLFAVISSGLSATDTLSSTTESRQIVKSDAKLLSSLVLFDDDAGVWELVARVVLARAWSEHISRVVVCWISGPLAQSSLDESGEAGLHCFFPHVDL